MTRVARSSTSLMIRPGSESPVATPWRPRVAALPRLPLHARVGVNALACSLAALPPEARRTSCVRVGQLFRREPTRPAVECHLLDRVPDWCQALPAAELAGVLVRWDRGAAAFVASIDATRRCAIEIRRDAPAIDECDLMLLRFIALEALPLVAPAAALLADLHEREAETLALIASGACDDEVCAHTGVGRHTVRKRLLQLYRRFGVQSRAELLNVRAVRDAFAVPYETGPAPCLADLSPRQRQVVERAIAGASEKEIAAELGLSPHTVHDALKAAHRKLGVRSRAELVALARCGGARVTV